ncbi:MAG: polysaccharide deacetylase family protein [Candidatus Omnitrophica bacterium]|nr:polysaccharide deacetylase family protein [Candidatus Omnitrophota bacterium]
MGTKLIVTVDAEENWEWPGSSKWPDTANIRFIPELQKDIFDSIGVRPVYLVTYPVATDKESASILKDIYYSGRCEIGAHLHRWNVPSSTRDDVIAKSAQCRLSRELEKHKIELLTRKLEESFGVRPVTFRAGRWAADGETIEILAELGYKIDVSVIPLTEYSCEGGADFFTAPFTPYYPSYNDICRPSAGKNNNLLEVPVTCGFYNKDFERWREVHMRLRLLPKWLHLVGLFTLFGMPPIIKLSPESADLGQMKNLVNAVIERGGGILHLTFHSSLCMTGACPYSRTDKERTLRIENLKSILYYILSKKGVESFTAGEVYSSIHG